MRCLVLRQLLVLSVDVCTLQAVVAAVAAVPRAAHLGCQATGLALAAACLTGQPACRLPVLLLPLQAAQLQLQREVELTVVAAGCRRLHQHQVLAVRVALAELRPA